MNALSAMAPASGATAAAPVTSNTPDTLVGFADATLVGSPASDTFVIGAGAGHETIQNFDPAHDTLQFSASLFANYIAAMTDAKQMGTDTVFTIDARDFSDSTECEHEQPHGQQRSPRLRRQAGLSCRQELKMRAVAWGLWPMLRFPSPPDRTDVRISRIRRHDFRFGSASVGLRPSKCCPLYSRELISPCAGSSAGFSLVESAHQKIPRTGARL